MHIATAASEEIASRFVAAIEEAFEPVRYFPLAGPSREQLAPGLRVTFHHAYAVYTGQCLMPLSSSVCCMAHVMR